MVGRRALGRNSVSRSLWLAAIVGIAGAASACQDVNVQCVAAGCKPVPPEALDNKLVASGNACTATPGTLTYPYKILFVIDVSGSTAQSDPTGGRGAAVKAVLDQYLANPAVSVAVLSFDTQPNKLVPTFTRDPGILYGVIPQLNQALQSTNYLDTLDAARDIIAADANQTAAGLRTRTRYDIQFLSDGVPNPCVDPNEVLAREAGILALSQTYGFYDMTVSTVDLDFAGFNDSCPGGATPQVFLQGMATLGKGTFQKLTGSKIKFNIGFSNITRVFEQHAFYVVNESRVVENNALHADSDRDGISDDDEVAQGSDPLSADPNNTGCTDKVNWAVRPNTGLCAANCALNGAPVSSLPDADLDGLYDCEELAMGTNHSSADGDHDHLIDSLEVRFGTNPVDAKTISNDTDLDGTTDMQEVLTGTDPFTPESDRALAYVYQPLTSAPAPNNGVTCFNFTVDNVQLVQTQATAQNKAGDNVICAYVYQAPIDNPTGEPTVSRACKTVSYQVVDGNQVKAPADGQLSFSSADFVPYICPGGCTAAP